MPLEFDLTRTSQRNDRAGELLEEPSATVATTIALMLCKHQAALGTTHQYSAASAENTDIISNLVCHPGVTIFA